MPQLCEEHSFALKCWGLPQFSPSRLCLCPTSGLYLLEGHGLSPPHFIFSGRKEGLSLLSSFVDCSQVCWSKTPARYFHYFIIIMNYSACITIYDSMILWSPWEAPGIVLVLFVQSGLVQLPGVWQSQEVHGFLTIIHLGDRSFSASSVFFFYLTAWWASTSPNFLFLGAMK